MDAGPGTDPGTLGFFIGVWVVMMAAMMFPSISPMVLMYVAIQRGQARAGEATPAGRDRALRRRLPGHLDRGGAGRLRALRARRGRSRSTPSRGTTAGPYLAGGVIIAAAALPAHPAEGRLPAQVPQPVDVPAQALAARAGRRAADGHRARRLVRRLLLGADGGAVRARGDEPRLDGLHRRPDRDREAPALAGGSRTAASRCCSSVLGLAVAFAPEDVPGLTLPDSAEADASDGVDGDGDGESKGDRGSMDGTMSMQGRRRGDRRDARRWALSAAQNWSSLDHSNGMCLLERPSAPSSKPNRVGLVGRGDPVCGRPLARTDLAARVG